MLRLSPAAELAVRGALVLAERFGEGPVTLATICEQRDLPKQYLTKIFGQLARAELVTPIRGKNGGYELAREPDSINVLEVIEAVEGKLAMNYCQHDPPKCEMVCDCGLQPVWARLQEAITEQLSAMTLRDVVEQTALNQGRDLPAGLRRD